MQIDTQGDSLLIVSAKGMGKRSALEDFRLQKRGGKGIKCYKITEKTGDIVGVKGVNDDHEIMMITTAGIIIQIRMNEVKTIGRITSGVKLMNLSEGVTIVKIAKVRDMTEAEKTALEEKARAEEKAGLIGNEAEEETPAETEDDLEYVDFEEIEDVEEEETDGEEDTDE